MINGRDNRYRAEAAAHINLCGNKWTLRINYYLHESLKEEDEEQVFNPQGVKTQTF